MDKKRRQQLLDRLRAMDAYGEDYARALGAAENELELRAQQEELLFPARKDDPMRGMLADSYLRANCAKREEKRKAALAFSKLFRLHMVGIDLKLETDPA